MEKADGATVLNDIHDDKGSITFSETWREAERAADTIPAPPSITPTVAEAPAIIIPNDDPRFNISASEVAAIVGEDKWRNAHDIYARKMLGKAEDAPSYRTKRGHALEPLLLDEIRGKKRSKVLDNDSRIHALEVLAPGFTGNVIRNHQWTIASRKVPWMVATPDGVEAGLSIAECKVVGIHVASEWDDELGEPCVPFYVMCQNYWQANILEVPFIDVAAALDTETAEPRLYLNLERDAELEGNLIELVAKFRRDHLIAGKPPEPDGSEGSRDLIRRLYPRPTTADMLDADIASEKAARAYLEACAAEKEAKATKARAMASLQAVIAEHEGVKGGGWRATWKWREPVHIAAHEKAGYRHFDLRLVGEAKPKRTTKKATKGKDNET